MSDKEEENEAKPSKEPLRLPRINVVDINKLLDPNAKPLVVGSPTPSKGRKSVTFDSSVIVLSSSDEETPKKDPGGKNSRALKSVLRNSGYKKVESSVSGAKKKTRATRKKVQSSSSSKSSTSSESDSDSDFAPRTTRRLRNKRSQKTKFTKLVDERATRRLRRKKVSSSSESEPELDQKFKCRITIDLPKFKCGELKRIWQKNSEVFDAKWFERRRGGVIESSDSDDVPLAVKAKKVVEIVDSDSNDQQMTQVTASEPIKEKITDGDRVAEPVENVPDESERTKNTKDYTEKPDETRTPEKAKPTQESDSDDSDQKKKPKDTKLSKKSDDTKKPDEKKTSEKNKPTLETDSDRSNDSDQKKKSLKIIISKKLDDTKKPEEKKTSENAKPTQKSDSDDSEKKKTSEKTKPTQETDSDNSDHEKKSKKTKASKKLLESDSDDSKKKKNPEKAKKIEPFKKKNSKKAATTKPTSESDSDSDKTSEKSLPIKDNSAQASDNVAEPTTSEIPDKTTADEVEPTSNIDSEEVIVAETEEQISNKPGEKENSDSDFGQTKKKARKHSSHSDISDKPDEKRPKTDLIELSDSDSSDSCSKKKDPKKAKKKNVILDTESEQSDKDESDKEKSEDEEEVVKPRKRIKRVSSSDDDDKSTRKKIRHMIDRDSLQETTKKAEQDEKERKARILDKQKKYNQIFELKSDATVDKVVLDFDEKTQKPLLKVDKHLVKQLKPHQVQGVKFMWDACFESLQRAKNTSGSGCILAHCMGLGKTLQVITLAHALLINTDKTNVKKIMVVCPLNTVINWKNEFKKWIPDDDDFEVYELVSCKTTAVNQERNYIVKLWHDGGGVLIVGYNMFRNLSNPDNKAISKKLRSSFQKALVDPGPDLVVCDEGHLLKNEKTNLSIAMNRIKTARRIVLTGTPLQNNLREYWCMVQFIKPNLLGTYKEYLNRFVNPIINGQYTDSTQHDIQVMRRRSHVLHKLLDGVVQRQDYAVLEPYLPPKYEYVLFIRLTEIQRKLYQHYMVNFARKSNGSNTTSFLFTDFQEFQRISIHPRVLMEKSIKDSEKKEQDESESEGSIKDFIDDSESGSSTPGSSSSHSGSDSDASVKSAKPKKKSTGRKQRLTRAQVAQRKELGVHSEEEEEEQSKKPTEWFDEFIDRSDMDNIKMSAKLTLLFEILKECEDIGDKILVFSQSLYTLNCIEYFLAKIEEATQRGDSDAVGGYSGSWALGLDYFRLDGSSSCDNRANWCDQFNDPDNTRARLFLISTKAGGLGINLVAANRVIIFDVSWNPSHDIQSIYRVYRFGQTKPSYIYRFVTYGAMEMKIYERQVTKQAISKRVIDEQQIDRHYSQHDIMELYKSDLDPSERPIPMVPKDVLLGEMLQKHTEVIYKYHEHQSLLENKHEEQLDEVERKAAWDEFENEKVLRRTTTTNNFAAANNQLGYTPALMQLALTNIVRRDNPGWSEVQIKGIVPALYKQMLMQMSENNQSVFARVQKEVELMQALHAQRMFQQFQMQQVYQQQQNSILNNLLISPEELRALQSAQATQNFLPHLSGSSASNDVIELND